MLYRQGTRDVDTYFKGNVSAGLRQEDMESSEEEVESGESKAEFGSAGSEGELANVNTECEESKDETLQ